MPYDAWLLVAGGTMLICFFFTLAGTDGDVLQPNISRRVETFIHSHMRGNCSILLDGERDVVMKQKDYHDGLNAGTVLHSALHAPNTPVKGTPALNSFDAQGLLLFAQLNGSHSISFLTCLVEYWTQSIVPSWVTLQRNVRILCAGGFR